MQIQNRSWKQTAIELELWLMDRAYQSPVFPYGEYILWERPIQTIASLFVKPGDDVIDIGSNTGGLAIAFSRLVGNRGRVTAFECNPSMVTWCRENFEVNTAENVELLTDACYRSVGETLEFVCEDSVFATGSSLTVATELQSDRTVVGRTIEVQTTTVDHECARLGLKPSFVKIDVEGAEIDALIGAEATIATHRPVIVFERASDLVPERDPLPWIIGKKYRCFDVNTLVEVKETWPGTKFPNNILALPIERKLLIALDEDRALGFTPSNNSVEIIFPRQGVYRIDAGIEYFDYEPSELEVCNFAGQRVHYIHAPAAHLADPTCRCFPFEVEKPGRFTLKLTSPTAILTSVSVQPVTLRSNSFLLNAIQGFTTLNFAHLRAGSRPER
jgi:FkbM family methyltransferase